MPLPTLGPTIDDTGISIPSFDAIYQSLIESFQSIYGSDAYITPDSQDGQWLGTLARGFDDSNKAAVAVWNRFRPGFATGRGLDSMVKLNGIRRQLATNSVADVFLEGVQNTVITGGVVEDLNGNKWDLPATVTIPFEGTITVQATAQQVGAIVAPAGSISKIATPIVGWQTVNNPADALPGAPVESDAALRRRQASAASLPANSNLGGLQAGLEAIEGVVAVRLYENQTNANASPIVGDPTLLAPHSIAVVISGGDNLDIATTIGQKKGTGADLNGTTTQSYTDPNTGISYDGIDHPIIKFYRLVATPVLVSIDVQSFAGWNDSVKAAIQQSVADYINGLGIGEKLYWTRLFVPANLYGGVNAGAFRISALLLNGATADVQPLFDHAVTIAAADVTINVVP